MEPFWRSSTTICPLGSSVTNLRALELSLFSAAVVFDCSERAVITDPSTSTMARPSKMRRRWSDLLFFDLIISTPIVSTLGEGGEQSRESGESKEPNIQTIRIAL